MEGWIYEDGELVHKRNSILVKIKPQSEKNGIEKLDFSDLELKNLDLSPYFFCEWRTYIVEIKENGEPIGPERAKVYFGEDEAKFNKHGSFWEYEFKNYIGKSELKIDLDNRELPTLKFEVLSPKLSLKKEDKLFYPKFYRALVESLDRNLLTLPIDIISPTYIQTEDRPGPYDLRILYHQLLGVYEMLLGGLRAIIANPHVNLTVTEEYVELHEIETVTPEMCLSIFQNPSLLIKSEIKSELTDILNGYLPNCLFGKNQKWRQVVENIPLALNPEQLIDSVKSMGEYFYPSHPKGHYPYL